MSLVGNGTLRVSIPADFQWSPGQHIFVRFVTPGLHSLTAHPFTICSLPVIAYGEGSSELVLYIQPRGGFTSRLARLAAKQPDARFRVLLDGPYGGVDAKTLAKSDKALIIAGGSGAGFTLPLIEDVIRRLYRIHDSNCEEKGAILQPRKTELQVTLATRDRSTQEWYHEAIDELLSRYPSSQCSNSINVSVYYTGSPSSPASSEIDPKTPLDIEKAPNSSTNNLQNSAPHSPSTTSKTNFESRPDLPSIIQHTTSANGTSVGIAVCGPASMLQDVRNAAAAAQARFLKTGTGAKDVYLHTENFS